MTAEFVENESVVEMAQFKPAVRNICGSSFIPKEKDFQSVAKCTQVVAGMNGIQLLSCDGRDFRSYHIAAQQLGNAADVVVDKQRLQFTSEIFEESSIKVSLVNGSSVRFQGPSAVYELPDVSNRLEKVKQHGKADFQDMYKGYLMQSFSGSVKLPLVDLQRLITKFDYRRAVGDSQLLLEIFPGGLNMSQAEGKVKSSIALSGNIDQPLSIMLNQSAFKNLIRTVGFDSIQFCMSGAGLACFKDESGSFEAFMIGRAINK
jgi:hypothetical protein